MESKADQFNPWGGSGGTPTGILCEDGVGMRYQLNPPPLSREMWSLDRQSDRHGGLGGGGQGPRGRAGGGRGWGRDGGGVCP